MTSIQWTDATWNPVRGCSRVSPGCDNCYAMGQAHRFSGPGKPYEGLTTIRRGRVDWTGTARLHPEMLAQPLKWRKPRRVFVNSMSDLFHPALSNEDIAAVFGVMAACPQHTFQVLTKRPQRMCEWFRWAEETPEAIDEGSDILLRAGEYRHGELLGGTWVHGQHGAYGQCEIQPCWENLSWPAWPLPNVWLGVSTEDQQRADDRIPHLLDCPAAVRFLSCEPLLGRIDLTRIRNGGEVFAPFDALSRWTSGKRLDGTPVEPQCTGVDWVIVGGESGHGARECEVSWVRRIVSDCQRAGVPVFVKQLGSLARDQDHFGAATQRIRDRKGGDPSEWPEDLRVREWPGVSNA